MTHLAPCLTAVRHYKLIIVPVVTLTFELWPWKPFSATLTHTINICDKFNRGGLRRCHEKRVNGRTDGRTYHRKTQRLRCLLSAETWKRFAFQSDDNRCIVADTPRHHTRAV